MHLFLKNGIGPYFAWNVQVEANNLLLASSGVDIGTGAV